MEQIYETTLAIDVEMLGNEAEIEISDLNAGKTPDFCSQPKTEIMMILSTFTQCIFNPLIAEYPEYAEGFRVEMPVKFTQEADERIFLELRGKINNKLDLLFANAIQSFVEKEPEFLEMLRQCKEEMM